MRWMYVVTFCVCALSAVSAKAQTTYVLGVDAESEVREILQVGKPLDGDVVLSAAIESASVLVVGMKSGVEVLRVRLVHPMSDQAKEVVGGGFALAQSDTKPPQAMAATLKDRLGKTKRVVRWKVIDSGKTPENPRAEVAKRSALELSDVFSAVEHKRTVGELDAAKRLLLTVPASMDAWARVEVGFLWTQLSEPTRAQRILEGMEAEALKEHTALRLAKNVILGQTANIASELEADKESVCDSVLVVNLLHRSDKLKDAQATARLIRTIDPNCIPGWETEISLLLLLDRKDDAMKVAQEAQKRLPDAEGLWQVLAYLYQETGELEKAVELLDKAVRRGKPSSGSLRNLLGTVVRNSDNRQRYLDSYLKRHRANPDDIISQMIAGVILHYENRFKESNKLLEPLEEVLGHSDRLHIYLAMNAFNLGGRSEALERLGSRIDGPSPDPDVFYCRAEILRDTDREQARDDLDRYRMMSEGRRFSNPDKDKRIRDLTALLDACIEDGREVCEGPWEHPRLRHQDNNINWWRHPVFYALALALFIFGLGVVLRRRRVSEED